MINRIHRNPLKNEPGKSIVNRNARAMFYCLACEQTYQKCKCRVYVSADTLERVCPTVTAREMASTELVQT